MLRRPKILAALAAVALPVALTGVSLGGPPAEASSPAPAPSAVAASALQRGRRAVRRTRVRPAGRLVRRVPLGRPRRCSRARPVATARCTSPHWVRPRWRELSGKQKIAKPDDSCRTLYEASKLTGLDPVALRNDVTAQHQRRRRGAGVVPEVARPAGRREHLRGRVVRRSRVVRRGTDKVGAGGFADDVYSILAKGAARTTNTGQQVVMPALAVTPDKSQLGKLSLPAGVQPSKSNVECPPSLGCEWLPAPYSESR